MIVATDSLSWPGALFLSVLCLSIVCVVWLLLR